MELSWVSGAVRKSKELNGAFKWFARALEGPRRGAWEGLRGGLERASEEGLRGPQRYLFGGGGGWMSMLGHKFSAGIYRTSWAKKFRKWGCMN